MSDELRARMHAAADGAPTTADWRELTRSGVAARRRRKIAAATAGAGAFVLAAAAAFAPTPSSRINDTLRTASPPAASPTDNSTPPYTTPAASPSPAEVTAKPSAAPTANPPQASSPAAAPLPVVPTPSPSCGDEYDCADGKAGWFGGHTGCTVSTAADVPAGRASDELFPGVTATVLLTSNRVASGSTLAGRLELRSARSDRVSFQVEALSTDQQMHAVGPGGGSKHSINGFFSEDIVELAAGESRSFPVAVPTRTCGDTSADTEPALAPGRYTAGRRYTFKNAYVMPPASPGAASTTSPKPTPTGSAQPVTDHGTITVRLGFSIV